MAWDDEISRKKDRKTEIRDEKEVDEETSNDYAYDEEFALEVPKNPAPVAEYGYYLDPETHRWVRKETEKAAAPTIIRRWDEPRESIPSANRGSFWDRGADGCGIKRGEAFKGKGRRARDSYDDGRYDPYRGDPDAGQYGERDYDGPKYGGWKGKPKKRDWWFDEYGFGADRVNLGDFSLSQRTRETFFGWYSYDDKDVMGKCRRILGQLDRSANTIANSMGALGEEKRLEVRYTDGKSENEITSPVIYVNPDPIIAADGTGLDKVTDGMTGHVLIGAQLKKNAHVNSYREARKSSESGDQLEALSYELWKSIEGSIARKDIITSWPGYATYMVRHSETMRKNKGQIEELVQSEKPSAVAAALGISWNLFHDCDRIEMPEDYKEGIEMAAAALDKPIKPDKRLQVCRRIVKKLYQLYNADKKEPESPMQPSPDSGCKKNDKNPVVVDDELFGGKVETEQSQYTEPLAGLKTDEEGHRRNLEDEVPRYWSGSVEVKPNYVIKNVPQGDAADYVRKVHEMSNQIAYVKRMLMFRNTKRARHEYGLVSGELDEDALHKVIYDSKHIWRKAAYISEKDIGVVILLDESGSMSSNENYKQARDVGICLYEGMKDITGIKMGIIGHTAQEDDRGRGEVDIREYIVPGKESPAKLMNFRSRANNLDGYAVMYAGRKLYDWFPESAMKIMFVVSDGHPNGYGYDGTPAYKHTGECVEKSRKLYGCEVYGIGVNNAYTTKIGKQLYGDGYFTILGDVKTSMYTLTRFMKQIAMRV